MTDEEDQIPAEVVDEAYALDEAITFERSEGEQERRVEAVAAMVEAENASAPSVEDVELLYHAPKVEPVGGGESLRITKYVVGDDGTPTQVELDV